MKLRFVTLLILTLALSIVPIVKADPSATIRIVPVGADHTGFAILTESPADLQINVTSPAHSPITDVWLLFVADEDTKTHITSITTNITSWTVDATHFALVTDAVPPQGPGGGVGGTYPGCEAYDQYQPGGLRGQLGLGDQDNIYYTYAYLIDQITTTPTMFTLTVEAPGASEMKVLVLALGYNAQLPNASGKLNERSPYSGSTLVVPQLSTFLLVVASFSALGLYAIRRKK